MSLVENVKRCMKEHGQQDAALRNVVEWWDNLPPRLRQDIEGSGAEPGCIAAARRLSLQSPT